MQVQKGSITGLIFSLLLLAVLVACGGGSSSNNNNNPTPTPTPAGPTEFLVVGNAGGGVSSFGIDATSGALTQVAGSPVQGSTGINHLAIDPSQKVVYATEITSGANLQSFTVSSSGALTSSATGTYNGSPGAISVDSAGKFAYITPDPSSNVQTVSAFSVDPTTHALAPIAGQPTGVAGFPRFSAIDPSGKFLYMSLLAPDLTTAEVGGRMRDATTGLLTVLTGSPFVLSGKDPRQIVITPGNVVLVANFGSNNISVLTLDPTTGVLTPAVGSPVGAGTGPIAIATDSTGKFAFVANQGSSNISVFSISGSTLTPVQGSPFSTGAAAGAGPNSVVVDPSGKFVYVTNSASTTATGSVSAFSLNATSGALTPISGSPFAAGSGPQSEVVAKP